MLQVLWLHLGKRRSVSPTGIRAVARYRAGTVHILGDDANDGGKHSVTVAWSWHIVGAQYGEGNGNPLQYSCPENPRDRGAWRATVHGVARVGHDLATKSRPPPGAQ